MNPSSTFKCVRLHVCALPPWPRCLSGSEDEHNVCALSVAEMPFRLRRRARCVRSLRGRDAFQAQKTSTMCALSPWLRCLSGSEDEHDVCALSVAEMPFRLRRRARCVRSLRGRDAFQAQKTSTMCALSPWPRCLSGSEDEHDVCALSVAEMPFRLRR